MNIVIGRIGDYALDRPSCVAVRKAQTEIANEDPRGAWVDVDDLNDSMGIPKTLTELGVKNPDLDRLVADALRDPSTGGNPVQMTEANTRALFEALL